MEYVKNIFPPVRAGDSNTRRDKTGLQPSARDGPSKAKATDTGKSRGKSSGNSSGSRDKKGNKTKKKFGHSKNILLEEAYLKENFPPRDASAGKTAKQKPGSVRTSPGKTAKQKPGSGRTSPGKTAKQKPGSGRTSPGKTAKQKPGSGRTSPGKTAKQKHNPVRKAPPIPFQPEDALPTDPPSYRTLANIPNKNLQKAAKNVTAVNILVPRAKSSPKEKLSGASNKTSPDLPTPPSADPPPPPDPPPDLPTSPPAAQAKTVKKKKTPPKYNKPSIKWIKENAALWEKIKRRDAVNRVNASKTRSKRSAADVAKLRSEIQEKLIRARETYMTEKAFKEILTRAKDIKSSSNIEPLTSAEQKRIDSYLRHMGGGK